MKRTSGPRKTADLSESVHQQLNMYVLAASAAGVGLLALAQSAEAKVVYTKTHVVIGTNQVYALDLNHDGIADFKIDNHSFFTDTIVASLSAVPARANNAVVGAQTHTGFPFSAYALRRGAKVGPKRPFSGEWMAWSDGADRGGRWANIRGRYLGLKFRIKSKIHYGWARLNVTVGHSRITATLTGYAYETIANKPIIAGQTAGQIKEPDEIDNSPEQPNPAALSVPTPESATLGALAMGAPGLSIWRRRD